MPNIMCVTCAINEESEKENSIAGSEADSDNLEDVEASAEDLIVGDEIPPTMFIGPTLVSDMTIKFYEQSGFFP